MAKQTNEELIEEGVSTIARGLFRLDKEDPIKAEAELHSLVNFFSSMHVDAMRKSKTVGGCPL